MRAGIEVLTEKGFANSGIDEILRRAGVPRGSFYHYFESKEAFGAELIDRYGAYFERKLDQFFLDESRSPLDRLRALVSDAQIGMAKYDYRRGCLIGNLGQELAALPETYRNRLGAVFSRWQASLARCLSAAQVAGQISPAADCERLSTFFWIGWEGAVLRAKLERNSKALEIFAEGFFTGLGCR